MVRRDSFTRGLAVAGTVLAWFPLAATVVLSAAVTVRTGVFRLDWLMPAELFPVALLGGLLLVWAAFRALSRLMLIGGSLAAAVAALVASQGIAVATGLASGRIQAAGWQRILVLALLAAYVVALLTLEVGGVLLVRDVWRARVPRS